MGSLVDRLSPLADQRILVTGMSGFKGSWLALWLHELGADVWGLSLPPATQPSLFEAVGLAEICSHQIVDIRDRWELLAHMRQISPTVVFHLAAQPLVLHSYEDPLETFDVNVTGSLNLLNAIRSTSSVKALVYVTSDKCYRNKETDHQYKEDDSLGGLDPYSASKAAAEIIFSSYWASFLSERTNFGAVSVRSGNVIGGGDWSENRLIPDCVRALISDQPIALRYPDAVRPWQHVLDPLAGYLILAADLLRDSRSHEGAWNFGPNMESFRTVEEVAKLALSTWGAGHIEISARSSQKDEAILLMLDSSKARAELGWMPFRDFESAVISSIDWYRKFTAGEPPLYLCTNEINEYMVGVK